MTTPRPPWALVRARLPGRSERSWLRFEQPVEVLEATSAGEVGPVLAAAERAARAGRWAVGFVSYEAAPGFDDALVTHPSGPLPLVWLGVFSHGAECLEAPPCSSAPPRLDWRPGLSRAAYSRSIGRIRELIAAGDTYQVNFTWRLTSPFHGDAWSLFHHLVADWPTDHASFVDTGRHVLCSATPELFFRLDGECLTCRPMKGTSPRGLTPAADRQRALELFDSQKNRAENLMIVDMIRNDLGRIARPGSVRVESLYDLERLDTVFQLTSTVTARSAAPPSEILAALFPCASVTGAPKVRTMEIIAELEDGPRGVYTGALGYLAPGGHAELKVAIRTLWIDRQRGRAEYGTGGGIVWDSVAAEEYEECRSKTRVLAGPLRRDVSLLETLLWRAGDGYHLLTEHLARLAASADYFGYPLNEARIRGELRRRAAALVRAGRSERVIRLLLDRHGTVSISERAVEAAGEPWRIALAAAPIDPSDRFLYHKTTVRDVYETAAAAAPGYDDVLLWNPRRELTESTLANLALRRGGSWLTPPVEAGLLAGTQRQRLLERGDLHEASLGLEELGGAEDLALLNSVRRWIRVGSVTDLAHDEIVWRRPRNPSGADP